MAVPAQHMRGVAEQFAPLVGPEVVMLSLTKGIELDTLCRPSEILSQVLGPGRHDRIGVLAGPNLALEVMAGQPAATVVAVPDSATGRWLQALLNSHRFRVYTSDDVVGCEIGGAVKNVIAIAAGVADGLGYGWNSRAALITRGLAELARLGVAMGGDPLTFLGLAGNGDLIATCGSDKSRNHRVGVALGRAPCTSRGPHRVEYGCRRGGLHAGRAGAGPPGGSGDAGGRAGGRDAGGGTISPGRRGIVDGAGTYLGTARPRWRPLQAGHRRSGVSRIDPACNGRPVGWTPSLTFFKAFGSPSRIVDGCSICDWDNVASDSVAILGPKRQDVTYDKRLSDLIGELSTRSDEFRVRWAAHNVKSHPNRSKSTPSPYGW